MGYTTRFTGTLKIEPALTLPHYQEIRDLADGDGESIDGSPDGYMQWEPTKNGDGLKWDGGEKFYYYVEWLQWLIAKRLAPWGYVVSGALKWSGEDADDNGTIVVDDNVVTTHSAADAETVQVFLPKSLLERYVEDEDCAGRIAEAAVKSARVLGSLPTKLT